MRILNRALYAESPRPRCCDGTPVRTCALANRITASCLEVTSAPPPSQTLTGTHLVCEPVALTGRPVGSGGVSRACPAPTAAVRRRGGPPSGAAAQRPRRRPSRDVCMPAQGSFDSSSRRARPTPFRAAWPSATAPGDPCPAHRRGNRTLKRAVESLCLDKRRP